MITDIKTTNEVQDNGDVIRTTTKIELITAKEIKGEQDFLINQRDDIDAKLAGAESLATESQAKITK